MDIANIGIIVDGPTETCSLEKMFLKTHYKTPILRCGPGNGELYSETMYAKRVLPIIAFLLNKNVYSIILIPDLEKRARKGKTTLERFSLDIKNAVIEGLKKTTKFPKDYLDSVIYVCPSDIMFENWIISDVEGIKSSKLIKDDAQQDFYDGRNGASILDGMMLKQYKKTVDAQNLFKNVNIEEGVKNSPSFHTFVKVLEELLNKK